MPNSSNCRLCNFSATGLAYPGIVFETAVNSFVLRFVLESPAPESEVDVQWHGIIRHVQTNTELRFVRIEEALAFMATYVPVLPGQAGPGQNSALNQS